MRKIRNQHISSTNPLLMFAQGVEQIVRDKGVSPTQYNDYELNAITRKKQADASQTPKNLTSRGFHIVDLVQELIWNKKGRQV